MKWASSLSTSSDLANAAAECAAAIKEQLGREPVDFAALFVSQAFADRYEEAGTLVRRLLGPRTLVGASAGGVIGGGHEVERKPALSVTAASMPGAILRPFYLEDDDLPDLDDSPRAWEGLTGVKAIEKPHFLLLADPFTLRSDNLVMGLDFTFPNAVKIGGLASAASGPGQNALYLNDLCLRSGAVGVAFLGNVEVEALVAQGCKPIGTPVQVTDCQQNILLALNNKPPIEILEGVMEKLSDADRELVRHSLFLGLAMDAAKEKQERGDFLVRNIIGADMDKGILAIGAPLRPGQTVQFHLRDATTSTEDLRVLLERFATKKDKTQGALLFSCVGRGEGLYGKPDHDSEMFRRGIGPVPLGGFFCNGEIGPVGGTTYLHGYTSCFGLFRPKS